MPGRSGRDGHEKIVSRIIGATLTRRRQHKFNHGSPEQDDKRKALNEFFIAGNLFDGPPISMPRQSIRRPAGAREFVPESATGGPGDKLHPNRVGYLAMGMAIDLNLLAPTPVVPK
jgi:hypothetical protein